jgi:hypothetical protein
MALADDGTWDPITTVEARAGIVPPWKAGFGDNADTDPNTGDGLLISIIANAAGLGFDSNTKLWANSFYRSATGDSLDRILDLFGKKRQPASQSTGTTVFYGVPLTAVPALTTVLTADQAANRFTTDALANVGADDNSDAWVIRIQEPVAVGDSYIVQIDANPALDTVPAPGDTVSIVAAAMRDDINGQGFATAALAGLDAAGSALIVVEVVGGPGNVAMTFTGAALLDSLEAVRVAVTSIDDGPVLATAGTLQSIATPIVGIVGASNDADADPGVNEETDDEFRARHGQTLFSNAARTDSGIKAAVEASPDITEVGVTSNRTTAPVDSFGRPIHSVEVVFLATPGVNVNQFVADAIARQIPAGIEPYGLASMGLGTTVDGEVIEVFATPTEELYLHLSITITAGEGFPTGGDIALAVKTATASYFDEGIISTTDGVITDPNAKLVTGKDMLRTAVSTPVNVVTASSATTIGVLTAVTALPTDIPIFAATDQPASPRQIVRADASRIAVTVV